MKKIIVLFFLVTSFNVFAQNNGFITIHTSPADLRLPRAKIEKISHDENVIYIKSSDASLSYDVGDIDSISLDNSVCRFAMIDQDYLNGWDEGYLFNDSLYFVSKTIVEAGMIEVLGCDTIINTDSLRINRFACINKVGSDTSTSIGIGYDTSDNVTSITMKGKFYTFDYHPSGDSVDVFCYDKVNNKYIISTYPIQGPSYVHKDGNRKPKKMARAISADAFGNALTVITLAGDVSDRNWAKAIDDVLQSGIEAVVARVLGIPAPGFSAFIYWMNTPKREMENYIFGNSSIVITSIDEKSSVISGNILNVESMHDVDWEFGNEFAPEQDRQYGEKIVVNYGIEVGKGTPGKVDYILGPEAVNNKTSWSFNLPKMSHGFYYYQSFLQNEGYKRYGNYIKYYCLGDPPSYKHSNEKLEYNGFNYSTSFHVEFTPLSYMELSNQGIQLEIGKSGRTILLDEYSHSKDISIDNLVKSDLIDTGNNQLALEVKVKYWYNGARIPGGTKYVDLDPFTIYLFGCPDGNHPHMIDLGLPSGTKWACCNVGANTPEGYGGYYAWGETEEKGTYNWNTYRYWTDYDGDGNVDSNEVTNLGSDIAGTQYDVAHVQWGGSWVMPSLDQIKELLNNCSSKWVTQNGVNGRQFIGPSGGTVFLPAAGGRGTDDLVDAGSYGYYWSSSQYPSYSYDAYGLRFYSGRAGWDGGDYRSGGRTVRPVSR